MIFLLSVENFLLYNAIHDFFIWQRNGSNPADNIRLQREKCIEVSLFIIPESHFASKFNWKK